MNLLNPLALSISARTTASSRNVRSAEAIEAFRDVLVLAACLLNRLPLRLAFRFRFAIMFPSLGPQPAYL